jgi:hypothetical protein
MATASAQTVAARGISPLAIAANSALKIRYSGMKNFTPVLLAAVFVVGVCADSSGRASAASTPNSLTMTCAQVQDYIRKHGQTLLSTGKESGNYSFDYAECGGTVPGYACTRDEAYCYVGWWCDYNYPAQVNSQVHDQGVNFCPAGRH